MALAAWAHASLFFAAAFLLCALLLAELACTYVSPLYGFLRIDVLNYHLEYLSHLPRLSHPLPPHLSPAVPSFFAALFFFHFTCHLYRASPSFLPLAPSQPSLFPSLRAFSHLLPRRPSRTLPAVLASFVLAPSIFLSLPSRDPLANPLFPPQVVDPDAVPKAVAKERPASKKSTVYAIRFFPAGDYAWLAPKELTRLTAAQINEYVTQDAGGRKAGDLMEGYKKALDPVAWEEEHAANPPAAKKRKSKSKAKKKGEDGDEEDELAADEDEPEEEAEEDEEKEKAGKKRKRASSPAPAKSKAKAPKAAKAKKGGKAKKSKTTVESEDDAGEEAEAEGEEGGEDGEARASKKAKVADGSAAQLESDPEALKVREWRHKLQKTFLSSNKSLPKEDEMPQVDSLFTTVEGYQNMNIEYLTFSKIGKVMRHIHLLEPGKVPRDDEFKFRDRAKALVDKWHGILNANKATDGESAAVTESTARMDLNGTGEGEGDLTVMDVTMNGDEA